MNFRICSLNSLAARARRSPVTLVCRALVAAFGLYAARLSPEELIARFGICDALVYPRVAFNVAAGRGSTYNLLTPTNGYHPLWMWLHVPVMFGAETISARLRLAQWLWIATAVGAAWAWSGLIRRWTRSDVAAGFAALMFGLFGWSLYVLYSGMETPLVLLGFAAACACALRLRESPESALRANLMRYAAAAALTFLARLDSIFLLAPTLAIAAPACFRAKRSAWLAACAIFCGLTLPYFLWNIAVFGHIMPVSGIVKTTDFNLSSTVETLSYWAERMARLGLSATRLSLLAAGAAALALLTLRALRRDFPAFARICGACAVGAAAQYAYYLLRMREINVTWHLYPQALMAYFTAVGLLALGEATLRRLIRQPSRAFAASIALFAAFAMLAGLATAGYHRAKQVRRPETAADIEIGKWMRTHLPPTARIAMHDSFVAAVFISQHVVVDLNGLVENTEGALLTRAEKRDELVRRRGCDYWIEKERVAEPSAALPEKPGGAKLVVIRARGKNAPEFFQYAFIPLAPKKEDILLKSR